MNIGYLFAIGATISFALSAFPYTFLHQYGSTKLVTFWRLFIASFVIALLALVIDGISFFNIFNFQYLQPWLWIGFSGIITFIIGDYLIFEAYNVLGPAKGSLLTALSPAMALVFGIVLLGENVNIWGVIGIAITILGIIMVNAKDSTDKPKEANKQHNKAIVFGLLGACCLGIGIALSKQGAISGSKNDLHLSPLSVTFIRIFVPFIIYSIYWFSMQKDSLSSIFATKKGTNLMLQGALLNPAAGIAFSMYSISYMDVAVAQTIFSISPLLSLVINIFYFKQKATTKNIIGAIVAVIGVVVLIFRNSF